MQHKVLPDVVPPLNLTTAFRSPWYACCDQGSLEHFRALCRISRKQELKTDNYLLCLTGNRNPENTEFTDLHINDDMAELFIC